MSTSLPIDDQRPTKIAFTSRSSLTDEVLAAHFQGSRVIGLLTTDNQNHSRFAVIDIDRHNDDSFKEANEKAAIVLHEHTVRLGCSVLLEDSNGRGGYKLWLLFKDGAPARWLRRFAADLVQDWKELGLAAPPEIFPKQDRLAEGKKGNFVRLPGRHHTLEHWSRIWDGGQWLEGEASAQQIISTMGASTSAIPQTVREPDPQTSAPQSA